MIERAQAQNDATRQDNRAQYSTHKDAALVNGNCQGVMNASTPCAVILRDFVLETV